VEQRGEVHGRGFSFPFLRKGVEVEEVTERQGGEMASRLPSVFFE
jgi:hypothetical protein